MAELALGIAGVAGTVDVCIKFGKYLVKACKDYGQVDELAHELSVRIQICWFRIASQLEIVKELEGSMTEDQRELQSHILRILQSKLEAATIVISKPDRHSSSRRYRALRFLSLRETLESTVTDLESWQMRFEPSWFQIIKTGPTYTENVLTSATLTNTRHRGDPAREGLKFREAFNNSETVKLAEKVLENLEMQVIPYCETELAVKQKENKYFIIDTVSRDTVALRDARELASRLRDSNPSTFGTLKCKGVVQLTREPSLKFVFGVPDGYSRVHSCRDLLLSGPANSLTTRLNIARQLRVNRVLPQSGSANMDGSLSDLVHDYQLSTRYEGVFTIHFHRDPDAPPSAPYRQERWKKVRTLGHGGQGDVLLQTCTDGGRSVFNRAVKRIRLESEHSKRYYRRELESIVKFSHEKYSQYFVKSLGWYATSNKLYIAMEFFPDGDLYAYIRDHRRLTDDECSHIISQVLSGVAVMHEAGFAHRDVKAQNILVYKVPQDLAPSSWWVKLADFGIRGAVIETRSESGHTPLQVAAMKGYTEVAELLLEKGADIEASDSYGGFTPLGLAASMNHSGVTRLLLDKGANVEATNQVGHTPLISAARSGSEAVAKLLLNHGAHIEATDKSGGTPLIWAARAGSEGVIEHLIHHGAKVNVSEYSGFTPLREARKKGHDAVEKLLLRAGASIDGSSPELSTSLHEAAQCGYYDQMIVNLRRNDVNIEGKDDFGRTPLILAAREGHMDTAWLLFKYGANMEAFDHSNHTPLMAASDQGRTSMVIMLVRNEADVLARDIEGNTSMSLASRKGHIETVACLRDRNAPVDTFNNNGETPLILAAKGGHTDVARELLDAGADMNATDNKGFTPLITAAEQGHVETVKLLVERKAQLDSTSQGAPAALIEAAKEGHDDVVELLLEEGAAIETMDVSGVTALVHSVRLNHEAVVALLLQIGANAEAEDENGEACLMLAIKNCNKAVMDLLTQHGAKKSWLYYRARMSLGY
ncbi:hypothetical protein FVER53263_12914 [Fusarium verticillioides]|nr:hypothetical protein FVER53263_12914 [Fusarium verticillioides]